MHIRSRAPLRVSFAGGGTDVAPYPELEGGRVLSATIDRYAYATLLPRTDGQFSVESADFDIRVGFDPHETSGLDGKLDLVKAAVRRLSHDDPSGYDLFLSSNAPPGSGLGSSSAVMVALVGLLRHHYRLALDEYETAALAHSLERNDLGIPGGLQDQYAATFGGFNYIEFHADRVVVNPLRISQDVINELEHNLLLVFTGVTRASGQIIDDQTSRLTAGEPQTLEAMREQKQLAEQMKDTLVQGRLAAFAELLDAAWQTKKRFSPKITTDSIDEIYQTARAAGALGGKVTGAGGGGYILLYCDPRRRHRVAQALSDMGATSRELAFTRHGLRTWSVD
jgi:D-glycero-alpha-D-manno-heptose-7-phosphate kinase